MTDEDGGRSAPPRATEYPANGRPCSSTSLPATRPAGCMTKSIVSGLSGRKSLSFRLPQVFNWSSPDIASAAMQPPWRPRFASKEAGLVGRDVGGLQHRAVAGMDAGAEGQFVRAVGAAGGDAGAEQRPVAAVGPDLDACQRLAVLVGHPADGLPRPGR